MSDPTVTRDVDPDLSRWADDGGRHTEDDLGERMREEHPEEEEAAS